MAEQAQPNNAPVRGGGSAGRGAGRGQGGRGGHVGGAPATVFLNPERVPALLTKWQKLLGTDLDSIQVEYTADGVSVSLFGKGGTPYVKQDDEGNLISITIPEYRGIKAKELAPSNDDAIFAFKNKFEVRLNEEFPQGVNLGDGSEAAIRSAVQALPFSQRRVMLMSNKQFKTAYPNGYAAAANVAA